MARLSAKVSLLHPLVGHDLGRRADRDDPARVQTHHPLRKTHDRLHDVLDHDDGDALATELERPAMASSEISSFGCVAIARASSILRNSTWLSPKVDRSALDARPVCVRIDITVSRRCAAGMKAPATLAKSSATIRFSATVMLLNGRGI